MRKKLTTEYVQQQLSDHGFILIGEYINSSTSTEVECFRGHRYCTRVTNIINRGDGCSVCSGHSSKSTYTTKSINELIENRGIRMIDEFKSVAKKQTFKCEFGHIWHTVLSSVLGGTGCPEYYGKNIPWSKEQVEEILSDLNIQMIGDYVNLSTSVEFKCFRGHTWSTQPRSIVKNKSGCPSCAEYGFNPDKPAWVYLIDFGNYLKVGISNNLDARLARHRSKNGNHLLLASKYYDIGDNAFNLEKSILSEFEGRYVTKDICPDGYTETFSSDLKDMLIERMERS